MQNLSIIVWSKNRPFQLQEFIRTFRRYVKCQNFDMTIICKYDDLFFSRLDRIVKRNNNIKFVQEHNFWNQTFDAVNQAKNNFIMFGTDDVIFFRDLRIDRVIHILQNGAFNKTYLAFNTRWHKNLKYCQSAGMVEQKMPEIMLQDDEFCFFDHTTGTYDWHYPFEVSGSIYRKQDLQNILQNALHRYGPLNNPNAFEGSIAQMVINKETDFCKRLSDWCFCPKIATAACIPANRVSIASSCPTFDSGYSLESMNYLFDNNRIIDDEWYANNIQEAAHITKLVLK